MRVRAFAKINLSLRVLGVRPDGYHELRTVFQSIALHDTLTIRRTRGDFLLRCDDPCCPAGPANLVWTAAEHVWRATGRRGGIRGLSIEIVKRIPMGAGLGGGSSDAAAVIRALGRLWRLDPCDQRRIAARVGADVPYFLEGGTVLGLDRGDRLFPLVDHRRAWVVLALPNFSVSTKEAFGWWDETHSNASKSKGPHDEARTHAWERSGAPASPRANRPGRSVGVGELTAPNKSNDLEGVVSKRHPQIRRLAAALRRRGATQSSMSGSGSAVFGLFERRADAARAAGALSSTVCRTLVTRVLTRREHRRLAGK